RHLTLFQFVKSRVDRPPFRCAAAQKLACQAANATGHPACEVAQYGADIQFATEQALERFGAQGTAAVILQRAIAFAKSLVDRASRRPVEGDGIDQNRAANALVLKGRVKSQERAAASPGNNRTPPAERL